MSFESAVEDYRHGRLAAARRKLAAIDEVRAKLLFVRIYTRLRHTTGVDSAIAISREIWKSANEDLNERVEAGILLSFLLVRIGSVSEGERCIEETKQIIGDIAITSGLEAELWLGLSIILFAQHRYLESERMSWNAIYADLELGSKAKDESYTIVSIQTTKARAFHVLSLIRGTQERYHEQYRLLREAMTILRTARLPDVFLMGVLQANRSFYARDLGILSEIVELEISPLNVWSDDMAGFRLEVERSLGYLYALNGDEDAAIRKFQDASYFADSDENRLLLISDEAYISRQAASPHLLNQEMLDACQTADRIDWSSMDVQRYLLHAFAQELSLIDATRANQYLDRYLALESKTSPLAVTDKRADAEAQYSIGIVALASGQRDRGLDALANAYETWAAIGFRWRAAAAAIELADQPGHAALANYAARESLQYPHSWLARRVGRLSYQES